ncbi:MAG: hypothetical protein GXO56_06690 [Chloroflexi bacterium]|nr:hypothetical protein [Chloroflexota bacterium]
MRRFWVWLVLLGIGLALGGCWQAPAEEPRITVWPSPSPVASLTPSPVVTWFPPTSTPTPLPPTPIPTPTPDLKMGLGRLILAFPFADPALWRSPTPYAGHYGLSDGVLTVTVTAPRGAMVVLHREARAYDFYLEVEAEPQICRGEDAYGVVFRSASGGARYYRFGLNCQGEAFLDVVQGSLPIPQEGPVLAGVPAGAPIRTRLSVRAQGKTMTFAVNGQVLFTAQDDFPAYGSTGFGVFARAAGDEGMSVVFRDLVVYALSGGE